MRAPSWTKRGAGSTGQNSPATPGRRERDDADLFIDEVNEEMQRERLYRLGRKYGPYLLGGIAAAIIAVAVYEVQKSSALESAKEAGGQLIASADAAEPAARFEGVAGQLEGARVVAQLSAAAAYLRQDADAARAEAERIYAEVAASDAAPRYQDLARLRLGMLGLEEKEPSEIIAVLGPATGPDRPYQPLALELTAAAHLRAGDLEAARTALTTALNTQMTPNSARLRIEDQVAALNDMIAANRAEPETPSLPTGEGGANE